jgi:DDE superfamily endonuclease
VGRVKSPCGQEAILFGAKTEIYGEEWCATRDGLLGAFEGCFTRPTFAVFQAMVVGLVAQTGRRTVRGMLTAAGLAQTWSHDRAHRFFSQARWQIDQIGLACSTWS